MTQLELFAGIGGFGLAGHWAGIETVCQVEIDPFCQKVLVKNFPDAHRHDDIKTFDGTQWRGVDIISGGFPCQPYSTAGKRLGTEDERHLWPEMLRVIREASPRWVVGENVGGFVSWSNGLVFEQACIDLEVEGYEVQPFVLPACGVGAQHVRERIWIIAHSDKVRPDAPISTNSMSVSSKNNHKEKWGENRLCFELVADTGDSKLGFMQYGVIEPTVVRVANGLPERLDENKRRLGALGNAIVPQVAYQIFKSIVEYETKFA